MKTQFKKTSPWSQHPSKAGLDTKWKLMSPGWGESLMRWRSGCILWASAVLKLIHKYIMFTIVTCDKTQYVSFTPFNLWQVRSRPSRWSCVHSTVSFKRRAWSTTSSSSSSSSHVWLRVLTLSPGTCARMQIPRSVEGAEPVRAQSIAGSPAKLLGALSPICS